MGSKLKRYIRKIESANFQNQTTKLENFAPFIKLKEWIWNPSADEFERLKTMPDEMGNAKQREFKKGTNKNLKKT